MVAIPRDWAGGSCGYSMPATAPWTRQPLGRAAAGDLETKQEYGMMVEKLSNVTMVNDGDDIFIEVNGAKIAKRGKPGTPQAGTWISLEPGWTVSDSGTHSLEIAHDGVPLQ